MNLLDHLLVLEERLLDPEVRRDQAQLEQLLAPAFMEFGSSGRIFTREQIIAELASELPSSNLSLTHFNLVAHSADWALVTYRTSRPPEDPHLPGSSALRSSTWIKRDGRWQMLFHQGTPTGEPPPRTLAS